MQPERQRFEPYLTIVSGLVCLTFVVISSIPLIGYLWQIGAVFGFIYLSSQRRYLLSIGCAIGSLVLGGLIYRFYPPIIFNWAAWSVPSLAVGIMLSSGATPSRSLMTGGAIAIGVALIVFGLSKEMIFDGLDKMQNWMAYIITSSDLPETTISDGLGELNRFFSFLKRMMPSILSLSVTLQLFVGWLLYYTVKRYQDRFEPSLGNFIFWKMPGYCVYLTGAILLGRIFGGETIKMIADNALLFIGFFYAVFGLALIEYYLKKIRLTMFLRVLFYIGFLLLQVPGLILAAALGFIDSYFDFRKVRARIIG